MSSIALIALIINRDVWHDCQQYLPKVLEQSPWALLPTSVLLCDRRDVLSPAHFNLHEEEFQIAFYSARSSMLLPPPALDYIFILVIYCF